MMDGIRPQRRLLYAGVIRVAALILVVFSHVFSSYCEDLDAYGRTTWWMTNVMNTFIRPCGPLFFMISGLLLLDPSRSESMVEFFKKRAVKILIPFAAWSVLSAVWLGHWQGPPFTWSATLRKGLQEPIETHLWFIYDLVGLYLVTPLLRAYVRNVDKTEKIYFIALWVFSICLPPALKRFFSIDFGDWLVVTTGFIGYFLLGHFLRDVFLNAKQRRGALSLMFLLYAFGAAATYHLTKANGGNLDEFFYDDKAPNVIALTVLMFLWMKSLPYEEFFARFPRLIPVNEHLRVSSFGIYLMHMIILEGLGWGAFGFVLSEHTINPLVGIVLTTAAVLLIGAVTTTLLKQIPVVRRIVPG